MNLLFFKVQSTYAIVNFVLIGVVYALSVIDLDVLIGIVESHQP